MFARDGLPKPLVSGYYVITLDEDVGVGTHWVALYMRANRTFRYFDSFVMRPP